MPNRERWPGGEPPLGPGGIRPIQPLGPGGIQPIQPLGPGGERPIYAPDGLSPCQSVRNAFLAHGLHY